MNSATSLSGCPKNVAGCPGALSTVIDGNIHSFVQVHTAEYVKIITNNYADITWAFYTEFHSRIAQIAHCRMRTDDLKELRRKCQVLHAKIAGLRTQLDASDSQGTYLLLETKWDNALSVEIHDFSGLRGIRACSAREDFLSAGDRHKWFARLQNNSDKIDGIKEECPFPEDLQGRIGGIEETLFSTAAIFDQMLEYIDTEQSESISDMETKIESARQVMSKSTGSTDD